MCFRLASVCSFGFRDSNRALGFRASMAAGFIRADTQSSTPFRNATPQEVNKQLVWRSYCTGQHKKRKHFFKENEKFYRLLQIQRVPAKSLYRADELVVASRVRYHKGLFNDEVPLYLVVRHSIGVDPKPCANHYKT